MTKLLFRMALSLCMHILLRNRENFAREIYKRVVVVEPVYNVSNGLKISSEPYGPLVEGLVGLDQTLAWDSIASYVNMISC